MASIALSVPSLAALKKALRIWHPDVRSSHLSEAMAQALGRRTYAALLVDVEAQQDDPMIAPLDNELFLSRLQELGYPDVIGFDFESLKFPGLITTKDPSAPQIEYRSARLKAWRNIIVLAVNEGLRRKLFTLRPGDNRWPGVDVVNHAGRSDGHVYDFALPNGLPALGYVSDAGFDELNIHVAVVPEEREWVMASNAGFLAGDAFATTWLERRNGAWIQTSTTSFRCRKRLLHVLASLDAKPDGYGDRGRVIM